MNEAWGVVTIIGLLGWISSAIFFIFKALPESGRFEKRPALVFGGILAIFYALWIAGMLNA